jgi:hypothetical protein
MLQKKTEKKYLSSSGEMKPSGSAVAVLISGALGCFTIGLMIIFAEASKGFNDWLNWFNPVGPLSGKTGMGLIVWLFSWVLLYSFMKNKEIKLKPAVTATYIILALAILFSFPVFFDLFAAK